MLKVVIMGASGMVGGYALRSLLEDPSVERVTAIGRKPLGVSDAKLTEILHKDFANCADLATTVEGHDAVVYCLGTYTGAVTNNELRAITLDYTVEFARVLQIGCPNVSVSFLSGNGADPSGKSRVAYARYKGAAENALLEAGFPHVYLFRPAYIYPVVPRKEPTFAYRLLRWVYPAFRIVFPNLVIRADDLGRVMVDVALRGAAGHEDPVFENRDIRALASARTGSPALAQHQGADHGHDNSTERTTAL
jgi:uncharacterized protein YbjT (DUF2867 family)